MIEKSLENIQLLRRLRVKTPEILEIIAEKVSILKESGTSPHLMLAGQDYLSAARDADNYHTMTLLMKLYSL